MTQTDYYAQERSNEQTSDADRGNNPPPSPDDLLYAYLRNYGQVNRQPRVVTVANPSAGSDWTTTVQSAGGSGNVLWVPLAITAKLVTSAVVANRQSRIGFTLNGSEYARVYLGANETATSTLTFAGIRGGGILNVGSPSGQQSALPMMPVLPGTAIASTTVNIDVGDQWSAIVLYVLELTQSDPGYLTDQVQAIRDGSPYFESYPGVELGL